MSFFKNFPKTFYDFLNQGENYQIDNIFQHVIIESDIFDNPNLYQKYRIRDGERPDVASYRLYGTTEFYWTFFLINDKLRKDGINAWPLSDIEFRKYINEKYPNNFISAYVDPRSVITKGGIWPGTSVESLKENGDIVLVKLGLQDALIPSERTPDQLVFEELKPGTTTTSELNAKFIQANINTRVITFEVLNNSVSNILNLPTNDNTVYAIRKRLSDISPREIVLMKLLEENTFFTFRNAPRFFELPDKTIVKNVENALEDIENLEDENLQGSNNFGFKTNLKPGVKVIKNIDFERNLNEENSEIKVVAPALITRFAAEFKRIMNNE